MADENSPLEVAPASPPSPPPPSLPSSLSQSPVFKSLNHGAHGCVTCGHGADGRLLLHRLKHDGAVRHHCSSCILFYNKGMYCSQCFQVYRDAAQFGDPALWLTCCKCLRLSHLGCVRKRVSASDPSDFSFFTCQDCCDPSGRGESRLNKLCISTSVEGQETLSMASADCLFSHRNLPTFGDAEENSDFADPVAVHENVALGSSHEPARLVFQDLSIQDQEALAAANIVAALAANEAKEAKARARVTAAAAVKAASRAKAALDAAYRAAREEARWKVEASRNFSAIAGQAATQITGGPQTLGAPVLDKRKLEAVVGNVDCFDQSTRAPSNQEELDRSLKSFPNAPRSPRTGVASYKRRTLSAIAASETTRALPSSCAGLQHGAAPLTSQQPRCGSVAGLGPHGSFDSTQEVADQTYGNPEHGLNAGSLVLADGLEVSASPASILESSSLLGTPRIRAIASLSETEAGEKFSCPSLLLGNDSLGNSQVSISGNGLDVLGEDLTTDGSKFVPCLISDNPVTETDAGEKLSCSSLLPGNDSLGNFQISISGNGLDEPGEDLATTEGSKLLPSLIAGSPVMSMCGVDGKLTNHLDIEELTVFSHGPDEAVTDDLVDFGALLPGGCERVAKVSTGFVAVDVNSASLGISVDNALLIEHTTAAVPSPEAHAGLGAKSTAVTLCPESGPTLAGEQGIEVHEEDALLGNKAFVQKIQRPILLNVSASNQAEKPLPCSMAKASVSTACSVPLQTTALAGVPLGEQ